MPIATGTQINDSDKVKKHAHKKHEIREFAVNPAINFRVEQYSQIYIFLAHRFRVIWLSSVVSVRTYLGRKPVFSPLEAYTKVSINYFLDPSLEKYTNIRLSKVLFLYKRNI